MEINSNTTQLLRDRTPIRAYNYCTVALDTQRDTNNVNKLKEYYNRGCNIPLPRYLITVGAMNLSIKHEKT
jgi:predicted metalloprotease with PDZ domain